MRIHLKTRSPAVAWWPKPLLENMECWPVELVAAGGLQAQLSLFSGSGTSHLAPDSQTRGGRRRLPSLRPARADPAGLSIAERGKGVKRPPLAPHPRPRFPIPFESVWTLPLYSPSGVTSITGSQKEHAVAELFRGITLVRAMPASETVRGIYGRPGERRGTRGPARASKGLLRGSVIARHAAARAGNTADRQGNRKTAGWR